MPGGNKNIKPEDGKQFSSSYQPDKEIWTEETSIKFCEDLIAWLKEEDENVFYDDFIFLNVNQEDYHSKAKIYPELPAYLAKKHSSCLNLLEVAKKIQETKLVKFSVFDKLNASMTKFCLINLHDWKEKSEVDNRNEHKINKPFEIKIDGKDIDLK